MKITSIPFAGRRVSETATELSHRISNLTGIANVEFPVPVRLWGREYRYWCMSPCGVLALGGWNEKLHFDVLKRKSIPESLEDYEATGLLLPFGEPQVAYACGTSTKCWFDAALKKVIIAITSKDIRRKQKFIYQTHLPVDNDNAVEYHYYRVETGYATIVGVTDPEGRALEWGGIREAWPYSKVALKVDCRAVSQPDVAPPPKPETEEVEIVPPEASEEKQWRTVYEGAGYRVQEVRK